MKATEIETKVPIPAGQLKEVLDNFRTLDPDGKYHMSSKSDVYWKDVHDDIGNNGKILRIRRCVSTGNMQIEIYGKGDFGYLKETMRSFDEVLGLHNLVYETYITAKIKALNGGYENNIEKEVVLSDECGDNPEELFLTLGFKVKFGKSKFSVFHQMNDEPFNVEIVYVSKVDYKGNPLYNTGVWYVEIETTEELQEKMGTKNWKLDEYEGRICRIFQQLGLDPSTKDNRSWKDILKING